MTLAVSATGRLIRIGEVARGAGVSVRAVRYTSSKGCSSRSPARPSSSRCSPPASPARIQAKMDDLQAAQFEGTDHGSGIHSVGGGVWL
jgi:hypothetical protein